MAGRPAHNYDSFKDQIYNWYCEEDLSVSVICEKLQAEHGFPAQHRTLKRRLAAWNFQKNQYLNSNDLPLLRARICQLFFHQCLSDKEILTVLQNEGYIMELYQLQRLRREMGLSRRQRTGDFITDHATLSEILERALGEGTIQSYGRQKVYEYLRRQGLLVIRDQMYSVLRELDPESVAARRQNFHRYRGDFRVPGPNYMWCIDGHMKLAQYGIEIYGAIDAFSRYVPWMFIGVSGATQVGVLKIYLEGIGQVRLLPQYLRVDMGSETGMMMNAHLQLHEKQNPDVQERDVLMYGTSLKNIRIESWWGQLAAGQTNKYRLLFHCFREQGLFDDSDFDKLAIQIVYMRIIRAEVLTFVEHWNNHKIRKQKNRPDLPIGRPWFLYFHPPAGTPEFGVPLDEELFDTLARDVQDYSLHRYLPDDVYQWVCSIYAAHNIPRPECWGDNHQEVYVFFRKQIREHLDAGNENPELRLLAKPEKALNWQPNWNDILCQYPNQYEEELSEVGSIVLENSDVEDNVEE